MIKYGFFNAKKLITGDYDRKYNADDVNTYFKGAISRDGIYQFVGNQCRVIPAGNMNVYVRDGKGQINYHWFELTSNEILPIREAHATLNRWTAIVARYDAANRNIYLLTIDGNESERPSKPQIQRTDTLRDICLAYVYVAAGTTEITRNDIEDAVEDIEVCGFVETLLKSDSAAIKVPQLPIPSKSCQGNIYYLIEESKTAGKTYVKGYYYCEPSRTEYDYIDVDWISDSYANRPVASADYVDILFFANDNNKWYQCVEVSENTYEWQEVMVNEVEELPEPTEELNNQFYIKGNELYKVAKQESNYKWYMFGTGGGGSGDFALIKIEYPEGQEVTVTFNGETTTAPDTSGLWMYGCDEVGTYTIAITGTTAEVEVEITTQGQIETIWISPQIINYALIYYLGNEFAEPTEEEKKYAIKTGGWTTSVFAAYYTDSSGFAVHFNLLACEPINNLSTVISNYSNMFTFVKQVANAYSEGEANYESIGFGINSSDRLNINPLLNVFASVEGNSVKNSTRFLVGTLGDTQKPAIGARCFGGGGGIVASISKLSNCINGNRPNQGMDNRGSNYYWYAIGLTKTDDISGLSAYGNDIATILSNATDLFDDPTALSWMVTNCTGDFMISALSNSNFINAMNVSANKSILVANEHWNRFIALLSV